jgi:hypothetical protein
MTTPSQADINKKKAELTKHLKYLDEEGRIKSNKLLDMIRSSLRKSWMSSPQKLAYLEQTRIPDMNPATRTKWLWKCEICGGLFKLDDINVDHINGNHSFTKLSDFENYVDKILNVPISGLQILCVEDHKVKTYLETHNLSWEEAVRIKKAIKLENEVGGKGKGVAARQKKYLLSEGFKAKEIGNEEDRRDCFLKIVDRMKEKE